MILSHSIRLNPAKTQEAYFRRACGTARFAYNWGLAEWKRQYEAGEKPSGRALKAVFNSIRKAEFPWTYGVHRDCASQPFANPQAAFIKFFRKTSRFPVFKKRGQHDSFYVANDKFRLSGKKVKLPILGWVKLRESLRFPGKIMSATVSRQANRWMLSVQADVPGFSLPRTADGVVGVDLGLTTLATLSTGEKIEGPKALKKLLPKLRRESRQLSRKVKGSNNRRKAATKLARLHLRVPDVREDSLHKLTTRICRENQTIAIEDLNVKGMVRNHCLARGINDAGWGEFRRQLEYKSVIYNDRLVIADRWFPSSKRCSFRGEVKKDLELSERVYVCTKCGAIIDRDWNASCNLEKLGRVTPEVTPVEIGALAGNYPGETLVDEAGTACGHISSQER